MTTLLPDKVLFGDLASCISPPSLPLAFDDIKFCPVTLPIEVMFPVTDKLPVIIVLPFTSNTAFGVAFPIPTLVALSNIELVVNVVAPVNLAT